MTHQQQVSCCYVRQISNDREGAALPIWHPRGSLKIAQTYSKLKVFVGFERSLLLKVRVRADLFNLPFLLFFFPLLCAACLGRQFRVINSRLCVYRNRVGMDQLEISVTAFAVEAEAPGECVCVRNSCLFPPPFSSLSVVRESEWHMSNPSMWLLRGAAELLLVVTPTMKQVQ